MLVSDIQRRVQQLFGDAAFSQLLPAFFIDSVNDAQKDICRKSECLETVYTVNVVAGTDNYAYPADLIKEERVLLSGAKLCRLTRQSIDVLYPDRAVDQFRGNSLYYYNWARKVYLYPIPSTSVTSGLAIWYIRYAVEVTTTGDTPEIPAMFHEDIVRYCLWKALELDEQWTAADRAKQIYQENLMETIGDSQNPSAEDYPAVRLVIGDY